MQPLRTAAEQEHEYSTLEKVKRKLANKGVVEPGKPEGTIPDVPENLGDLPPGDVMDLYRRCEGYYAWVTYRTTVSKLAAGEWKNALRLIIANTKKEHPDDDPELDDAVIQARRTTQVHEQEAALMEYQKSVLFKRMAMLSRNVTAIQTAFGASNRGENMNRW